MGFIVVLPKENYFFFDTEPGGKSSWIFSSITNLDYFPLPTMQQSNPYLIIQNDISCPKDFELIINLDIPKCIKSESLIKLIETWVKSGKN